MTDADVTPAPFDTSPRTLPAARRRGRPPKDGRRTIELRGTVVKRYTLTRDDECTIGHLRRIVSQREMPESARIVFEDSCLTIEWTCD